jgi:OOP family OmpA-OmpF porin
MKKIISFLIVTFLFSITLQLNAQLAKNSWSFGFGFSYPRMMNPNLSKTMENFGGYLSIQRNFSEHMALRLKMKYLSITGEAGATEISTGVASGDIDMIYRFVPCEPISPYLLVGVGGTYSMYDVTIPANLDDQIDYQINLGFGADWTLDESWKLTTELAYHTSNENSFDGAGGVATGSLLGTLDDAYMTFDVGFQYFFSKGEPSKYCQLYDGISVNIEDPVDYERIENIVQKYIPKEVVKEVVVEKPVERTYDSDGKWVLVGVNFDFNSARLKSESYPVLFHAVQVLLQNPDMRIEIQGHTDNIGTEKGNERLSLKRAVSVKNYLAARGVSANRMTTVGYGEANPIADNKTAQGRAMNRRIEFKVID